MKDFMCHLPEVLRILRDAIRAYQDMVVIRRKELELAAARLELERSHQEIQLKKLDAYKDRTRRGF